MTGAAYARVLDALKARGYTLRGGRCKCPAHHGDGYNVSVRKGRDGVLLFCHSRGCSAQAIVEAIGLTVADLFDDQRPRRYDPDPPRASYRPPPPVTRCAQCHDTPVDRPGDVCRRCQDDPVPLIEQQTDEALALVEDDSSPLEWPFATLRQVAPPIPCGHVVFVAASSGGGKTTFVWSVVNAWMAAGKKGYILPLETRPDEWRAGFAALRLGLNPGELLSGALRQRAAAGDLDARVQRQRIGAELARLGAEDTLYVASARKVNVTALRAAIAHAARMEYDYVLIDHIDHVGKDDPSSDDIADGRAVVGALHDLALQYRMPVIATSQLNNQRFAGGDKLGRYAPPQLNWLYNPTKKEQVATQILGLFRPLRPDATPAELKAARDGTGDVGTVLQAGRAGVVAMKLRHQFGDYRDGKRVTLAYEAGGLRDLTDAERRDDAMVQTFPTGFVPAPAPRVTPVLDMPRLAV